jgi:hypothetical protein
VPLLETVIQVFSCNLVKCRYCDEIDFLHEAWYLDCGSKRCQGVLSPTVTLFGMRGHCWLRQSHPTNEGLFFIVDHLWGFVEHVAFTCSSVPVKVFMQNDMAHDLQCIDFSESAVQTWSSCMTSSTMAVSFSLRGTALPFCRSYSCNYSPLWKPSIICILQLNPWLCSYILCSCHKFMRILCPKLDIHGSLNCDILMSCILKIEFAKLSGPQLSCCMYVDCVYTILYSISTHENCQLLCHSARDVKDHKFFWLYRVIFSVTLQLKYLEV